MTTMPPLENPPGTDRRVLPAPLAWLRGVFLRDTLGEWIFPLVVLTGLYFFDEFDTAAMGTLAPDIQHAFHLSDRDFVALVVVNVAILTLLAVPVGYVADRVRRTPIVVASGIIAGTFSLLTGFAGSVAAIVAFRVGNGAGLLANGPVHNSLIADYYTPKARPGAFANHQNAVYIGSIVGPLVAGVMGWAFNWRAAFYLLFVPILIVSIIAIRLPEPVRGGTDVEGPTDALSLTQKSPPFRRAAKILWSFPTLRFQYIGAVVLGAGLIPLTVYLALYYQRAFGLGPLPRGVLGALNAGFTYLGVRGGGKRTPGWFGKGMQWPLRYAGAALAGCGLGLALQAASPWLALVVPIGFATSYVIGYFFAPYFAVMALVSPARVRSLSFSFVSIFLVLGVIAFYVSGLAAVSDDLGIRAGIVVLTPFWIVAGAVLALSGRFVSDDTNRAIAMLNADNERTEDLAVESGGDERPLLLGVRRLDASYGQVQVLFGVNAEIREGEIVALLGTNGAGKSTLLRCISGLLAPDDGLVWFDGSDISGLSARDRVSRGIIQMPGGRSIFPTLTVGECLRLAGWMHKRHDKEHVRAATAQMLGYFPVLGERRDQLAGDLSGGEQQMLGLAMAFIAKPKLLMIDELSLGLAPTIVGRLVEIVRQIHQQGTTIVLVEQSVNVALTLAQRALFMEKGEVRFSGATAALLERGDLLRSVFLEGATSANGKGASAAVRPRTPVADQTVPPVLQVDAVTRRFGGLTAVDGVSLDLHRGEILGLIGQNGAGKTTLFDLVSGYLPIDAGRVLLHGEEVTTWPPHLRAAKGLGRSFQDARLFPSLTVAEAIGLALERHLPVRDMLAAAMGMPAVTTAEQQVALRAYELIELLGLEAYAHKFVSELSTGTRRIVDLGMSLAHEPDVLLLDEPSSGIAQRETEALGPVLLRIQRELGASLLVIEHDMPLITSISNRLVALETGRVIAEGTPQGVVCDPKVIASYLDTDPDVIARSGKAAVSRKRTGARS